MRRRVTIVAYILVAAAVVYGMVFWVNGGFEVYKPKDFHGQSSQ